MTNIQEPTQPLTQRQKELLAAFQKMNDKGQELSLGYLESMANKFPTGKNVIPFPSHKINL